MTGASSRWTCTLRNETVRSTQKGNHTTYKCPEQGLMKLRREIPAPAPIPCQCSCGQLAPQQAGSPAKHWFNTKHYDAWRRKTQGPRKRVPHDAYTTPPRTGAIEKEAAFVLRLEQDAAKRADEVRLLTPEESYVLWGLCLGIHL